MPALEDPVGKHPVGVARPLDGINVPARVDTPTARQDMDAQAHLFRESSGLAAESSVAPQAQRHSSKFALEHRRAIPRPAFLVADHLPQVAHEVHHHCNAPFADGDVEAAAGIGRANSACSEVEPEKLRIAGRRDLHPAQRPQVGEIDRRDRAEERVSVIQPCGIDRPCRLRGHIQAVDVEGSALAQGRERRWLDGNIDEQSFRAIVQVESTLPVTLLNSPLPARNG